MDFCVKCGKKDVYDESLCSQCYEQEYPSLKKKKKPKVVKKKGAEKHALYYEAILQLRNPNQKLVTLVENQLAKKEVKVAKVNEVRGGLDYYLPDQKQTQNLANNLQRKFGGVVKLSRKLYSVSKTTSKKLYRLTVLFRVPKFKLGDVIDFKSGKFKVIEIGKHVFVRDAKTGKKRRVTYKELEKAKLI
ncbi:NMD3-related protein [Nanoarchaeota archaeon]